MKKWSGWICSFVLMVGMLPRAECIVQARPQTQVYAHANVSDTTLYFDRYYFLTDISCPFASIQRKVALNAETNTFEGRFVDTDLQGRPLLRGSYRFGIKEGKFQAYHLNGMLKWEGHFHEDRPTGIWKYYYPDGKAFLELEYPAESLHSEGAPPFQLRSYWDQRGRQRVKEGNGYFEMKMEYDGYNPYSVRFVQRKGRVKHGRPWSEWTLEWIFENGEKEEFAREQYRAKQPEAEPNEWLDKVLPQRNRHALLPIEWFEEAELMSRRPCTIDHHTGFISYLQKHLHEWFDDVYDEDLLPLDLEVKIELDANGHMQGLEFYKNFDKRRLADRLESAFEDVDYWYPSFLDGEYIEDKLIFTCKVFPDKEQKKLSFFDLHLIREQGF